MNGAPQSWARSARAAGRAFTFIELIIAVGLTIILLRGMFTVFQAATSLSALSEERSEMLLEATAVFDALSADLARSPFSGDQYLHTGTDTLTAQVVGRSGAPVYVKYTRTGTVLTRAVYTDQSCNTLSDETPDGAETVSRQVLAFSSKYYDDSCAEISDPPSSGGGLLTGPARARAVWLQAEIRNPSRTTSKLADSETPEERRENVLHLANLKLTEILPVMYR